MTLEVINSNSAGNCYLLTDESGKVLIVEAGVHFEKIKRALKFDLSKVVGNITTHSHKDHCKAVTDLLKAGVRVYGTEKELKAMDIPDRLQHFIVRVEHKKWYHLADYGIMPFSVHHDTPDPVGYMLKHPEMGNTVFLTDTYYCDYSFKGLNNIIVEANYDFEIIERKVKASGESIDQYLRDRVIQSHLSIDNCIKFLRCNDLSQVNNIVLIHLSNGNSDAIAFKKRVEAATGCNVHVAQPGLKIDFNKHPFL